MEFRGRGAMAAAVLAGAVCLLTGCSASDSSEFDFSELVDAPKDLSAWGLFAGDGASQTPAAGVIPYDLETALFSDYAMKLRFVKLPDGQAAQYAASEVFDFPVGTVFAKTFAYPADQREPSADLRLLETRVLVHLESGWMGLPYVWDEAQTAATLRLAGATLNSRWVSAEGVAIDQPYLVPNANQCKGCHKSDVREMLPIGPKARYLNHDYDYGAGRENQLAHWAEAGILNGAPSPHEIEAVPIWDDPATGSLDSRARAYLEINCGHCHNPGGPARTTGLDLSWGQTSPRKLGVMKSPVAAGNGTGDRLFGIVPGRPDDSIMYWRMSSADPGVMMPELGRRMVDTEGLELIREWIESLPPLEPAS